MPLKIIYLAKDHYGALRLSFDRIQAAPHLDDKDMALHNRMVKILGRWLDQINPLAPANGPHGVQRLRLNYSFAKLMAVDALELAHISPSAKDFATYLHGLVTDRRCWLDSEGI